MVTLPFRSILLADAQQALPRFAFDSLPGVEAYHLQHETSANGLHVF